MNLTTYSTRCPECAGDQVAEITDTRGILYAERVFECEECGADFKGEDAARAAAAREAADPYICPLCMDADRNHLTFANGRNANAHDYERHNGATVTLRTSQMVGAS